MELIYENFSNFLLKEKKKITKVLCFSPHGRGMLHALIKNGYKEKISLKKKFPTNLKNPFF